MSFYCQRALLYLSWQKTQFAMQEFFQFEGDKCGCDVVSQCQFMPPKWKSKLKDLCRRHTTTLTHTHTRGHTHILFIFFTRKCDLYEKSQQQHGSGLLRVRVKYFAAFELFKFNFQPAKEWDGVAVADAWIRIQMHMPMAMSMSMWCRGQPLHK